MCGNERREVKRKIWNKAKQSKRKSMMCKAYTPKDGSGLRDQTSGPGKSAWRLLMALPILASCMQPSASIAEDALVVNRLGASASMIVDVQHYCPPRRAAEGIAGYSLTNEKYLPDNFGYVNEFKMTRHIFSTARTSDSDVAIIIDNLEPRLNSTHCGAIIIVDSNGAKVRIQPSFRNGNFNRNFSAPARQAAQRLAKLCEDLSGDRAAAYFSGGVSSMVITEDGQIGSVPDLFFCDSAVQDSLSSIDVTLGSKTVRVSIVYSEIFLEEVK
jgi:hypothetical protein